MAERNVDLNGLLQDILTCDQDLKVKQELHLQATEARISAEGRLRAAQQRFDEAVAAARGIVPPVPAAAPEREIVADETPVVEMGPLPPTSPALKPGWQAARHAPDDMDDREDQTYEG